MSAPTRETTAQTTSGGQTGGQTGDKTAEVRPDAFWAGFRAMSPILPGVIAFGLMYGVAAVAAGLPKTESFLMSAVVFAGASQLAVLQLLGDHTPIVLMVGTGLVINLRMAMYSASLAPHFKGSPLWYKTILAYLLTDQAYAVAIARYTEDRPVRKRRYYLGGALTLWLVWLASTAAGVVFGAKLPESWSLEFAIPLLFLGLLFPVLRSRPTLCVAAVSGLVSVAAQNFPYGSGLMAGAIAGLATGYFCETRKRQ